MATWSMLIRHATRIEVGCELGVSGLCIGAVWAGSYPMCVRAGDKPKLLIIWDSNAGLLRREEEVGEEEVGSGEM